MTSQPRSTFSLPLAAFALAMLPVLTMHAAPARAQTLTVLHNFTGGSDGYGPFAGVTLDQQGRIYGTASNGGSYEDGVVYRLVREGEGWVFSPIYSLGSQEHDGKTPYDRVVFGSDGLLYGTTYNGGTDNYGTVFSLQPPATACTTVLCPWVETLLYSFTGGADGGNPYYGDLIFDQSGNIYGTTAAGGSYRYGVVFKLTRSSSGWTESVLWNFTSGSDGASPLGGVVFDNAGNLYGTTSYGARGELGTVYELSPTQSGWSETTLYEFTGDNGAGAGGLIWDAHGDLFGISTSAAYELTPQSGGWSFTQLYNFGGGANGSVAPPTFDSQGNLYGPLPIGPGEGEIFQLTPSGNQWIYSQFYEFACNLGTGCDPYGAVTFDANGNMYGTTKGGGADGGGVVWEITPQ